MSAFADVRIHGKESSSDNEMREACREVYSALLNSGIRSRDLSSGFGSKPSYKWNIGVFGAKPAEIDQILQKAGVTHLISSIIGSE